MSDLSGSILILVGVYVFVALVLVLGTRWTNVLGDDRVPVRKSSLGAQTGPHAAATAGVREALQPASPTTGS